MTERNILLALFFLLSIFVIVAPDVQAASITEDCKFELSCSTGFTEVAKASGATNAHLSSDPSSSFAYSLCCNSTITDPGYGVEDMMSVSGAGGNQGHAGDKNQFDFNVTTGYDGCVIEARTEY